MVLNIKDIQKYISNVHFVKKIYSIEQGEYCIYGKIAIGFEGLDDLLDFDFTIKHEYPLKSYGSESIKFKNKDLTSYNHVMEDGSICVHTSHNVILEQKLYIDFHALKNWIVKYYINKDKDEQYEHIIINESPVNEKYYAFCFTDCEKNFEKDEFGRANLAYLNSGNYRGKRILSYIIKGFYPSKGDYKECQWSNIYKEFEVVKIGFYYFIEKEPAIYSKFAFTTWAELAQFISPSFFDLLYNFEKEKHNNFKGDVVPLFIGYKIGETEIHWQTILLKIGDFPSADDTTKIYDIKERKWNIVDKRQKITWGLTRNTSYKYFFGRGVFGKELTDKKILIIGIGAIGSMIASTLARGGCKAIDFADYDIKEPENVCRSEYIFSNGVTNKTEELRKILGGISPFIDINILEIDYFEKLIKTFHKDSKFRIAFSNIINSYDLIFDCSTDDDLMYTLSSLQLSTKLINISITNHAKELVCAFYPNIYPFVNKIFSNILKNDVNDLYSPTGCWNPTFKASYNDINTLVQLSLRHINILFEKRIMEHNFVIQRDSTNFENLKIIEF